MSKKFPARKRLVAAAAVAPLRRRQGRSVAADLSTSAAAALAATSLGKLVAVGAQGEPWVDLPTQGLSRVPARATTPINAAMIGRQVVVTFLDGQPDQPVVLGVVRVPGDPSVTDGEAPGLDAIVDGERIVLTGRREIVLRCGKASIALAADGRVVIKGANLLATAAGTHRIRGGVVQIN